MLYYSRHVVKFVMSLFAERIRRSLAKFESNGLYVIVANTSVFPKRKVQLKHECYALSCTRKLEAKFSLLVRTCFSCDYNFGIETWGVLPKKNRLDEKHSMHEWCKLYISRNGKQ